MKKLLLFVLTAVLICAQALACGTERWKVKTLSDRDITKVSTRPANATIQQLIALKSPTRKELDAKPDGRFPEELKVYRVSAEIRYFKLEADGDVHIVLSDPDNPSVTMIAEVPEANCGPRKYAKTWSGIREALISATGTKRGGNLKHPIKVVVTGVGFFDFIHGQTGVAPNGFELHSLLSLQVAQ